MIGDRAPVATLWSTLAVQVIMSGLTDARNGFMPDFPGYEVEEVDQTFQIVSGTTLQAKIRYDYLLVCFMISRLLAIDHIVPALGNQEQAPLEGKYALWDHELFLEYAKALQRTRRCRFRRKR